MEYYNKQSVTDKLKKYDYLAKESDFIEVTEWHNGEGWDITINDRVISLTYGQLEAIKYLIKSLDLHKQSMDGIIINNKVYKLSEFKGDSYNCDTCPLHKRCWED